MKRQVALSVFYLIYIDLVLHLFGLRALERVIHKQRVIHSNSNAPTMDYIRRAVDLASIFYVRRVLCLQHAATATLLLRKRGYHAKFMTGVQIMPPKKHAWVEVDRIVVTDKPYMREIYQVIDEW